VLPHHVLVDEAAAVGPVLRGPWHTTAQDTQHRGQDMTVSVEVGAFQKE
jgi:hypothetical protein